MSVCDPPSLTAVVSVCVCVRACVCVCVHACMRMLCVLYFETLTSLAVHACTICVFLVFALY